MEAVKWGSYGLLEDIRQQTASETEQPDRKQIYCHAWSDCRRGIGLSTEFIGLQCTIYSYTLYNTTVYFTVFPRPSLFSAGPRTSCRPNSLHWLFSEDCLSQLTLQLLPWLYNLGSDHTEKAALTLLSGLGVTK
jgi:hypothetical protein